MEKLNELVVRAKEISSKKWFLNADEEVTAIDDDAGPDDCEEAFIGCAANIQLAKYIAAASPATTLAIAEAFRSLEQRAEAAEAKLVSVTESRDQWKANAHEFSRCADRLEAKLTEMEKQANEPAGYAPKGHVERYLSGKNSGCWVYGEPTADDNEPLFTRPAPAINLAELVPPKASMADYYENVENPNLVEPDEAGITMWDACRSAILRKIEEAR